MALTKWTIPIGVEGVHATQSYYEIPGKMPGLTSREDLENWKTALYLGKPHTYADFEAFGIYGKKLQRLDNGHVVLDIFEYGNNYATDNIFEEFRLQENEQDQQAMVADETSEATAVPQELLSRDTWVIDAVKEGRRGTIPRKVSKAIKRLAKEYDTLFEILKDNGKTFGLELFSGEAIFTSIGLVGGHTMGGPTDIRIGINLRDPQVQEDVLMMISHFKPYIVTCSFPCTPWTNLQNLNRARGYGAAVDEKQADGWTLVDFTAKVLKLQSENDRLGLAENPRQSEAWMLNPLEKLVNDGMYELIYADQCRFGLEDAQGWLRKKDTGFLVNSPSLKCWLERRCTRDHAHSHIIGGSHITEEAGIWPRDLAAAIVAGTTQDLAAWSKKLPVIASLCPGTIWNPSHLQDIASELYLRQELIKPIVSNSNKLPKTPANAVRRISIIYNKNGTLADYYDTFRWHTDFSINKLPGVIMQGDTILNIFIMESDAEGFPAVRPDCSGRRVRQRQEAYPVDDDDSNDDGERPAKRSRGEARAEAVRSPADRVHRDMEDLGRRRVVNDASFGPKPDGITMAQWGVLKKPSLESLSPAGIITQATPQDIWCPSTSSRCSRSSFSAGIAPRLDCLPRFELLD